MAEDPRVGKILQGRYKLLGLLAEGGMGVVYRAERVGIGRPVVVKFLHAVLSERPGIVDRFEREARATARLNHPNCVGLVDFGIEDNAPFLVMEYVEGKTLADLLDHGALPPERAVQIARQVLSGLSHAHERGILHRDLKPANVMIVDAVGWTDLVKILDFGLAKLFGQPDGKRDVTVEGIAIGTPGYMSPEQAAGVPSDRRSDVYCTGALLYHLVTGTKAFAGSDVQEVLRRHREETPASPRALTPGAGISVELEAVIVRAMEREPARRYQNADEMIASLASTPEARAGAVDAAASQRSPVPAGDQTRAEMPSSRARARRGGKRSGGMLLVGILLGAAATVALALNTSLGSYLAPPRPDGAGDGTLKWGNANAHTTANLTPKPKLDGKKPAVDPKKLVVVSPADLAVVEAPKPDLAVPAPRPDLAPPPVVVITPPDLATAPPLQAASHPPDGGVDSDDDESASADDGAGEDDRSPPPELPAAPHREMPHVRTIGDVRSLLRKGDADGALAALYRLRKLKPSPSRSAEIAALIGNLYFDRKWWTDALREYRFALALDAHQRSNSALVGNAIHTFADQKTWPRARRLVVSYIGRSAIPAVRKAARAATPPVVRRRAQKVLTMLEAKTGPTGGRGRGR